MAKTYSIYEVTGSWIETEKAIGIYRTDGWMTDRVVWLPKSQIEIVDGGFSIDLRDDEVPWYDEDQRCWFVRLNDDNYKYPIAVSKVSEIRVPMWLARKHGYFKNNFPGA